MEKIEKIYEALDSVDTKRSKHTNYHFAMSLRITDITKSLERIHIFGRRYLTGELKVMFLAFTALFVIVMGTLAMQDVYSLISAIVLATIVVFSVFYIFHLDGFTYSEQTILDNKITDLLNYLEGDNQVSVG